MDVKMFTQIENPAGRHGYLKVLLVETKPDVFEVALRIDGTYFDREWAERAAHSWSERLGVPLNNLEDE